MYVINDYIIYGMEGICQIIDIRSEQFGDLKERKYYILRPVYSPNSTLYVPVDNKDIRRKMRYTLTVDEIYDIIKEMPDIKSIWIEDDKLRNEKFNDIIKNGDIKDIVMLIKTVYLNMQDRIESGKKPLVADERIMAAAEKLLYEEFAVVLDIKPEEVVPFIMEQMELKDA